MFAAEFGTGQVFWSILWFFLFAMWILLVFNVIGDIFRSDDLSGVLKALWTGLIIFLPYLGVFAYLITRGGKMAERQIRTAQAQESALQDYIRSAAGTTSPADQLVSLAELHTSGKLTDEEYANAKANIIAS